MEADQQMQGGGLVWQTLRQLAGELDRLGIPYAVVGGIALQHFGVQRSTQDVDLLIGSPADLVAIQGRLVGRGYLRKPGTRHLRDEVTRVRIEFLIAGEYPGDGQPKPVQFPNPAGVCERSADNLCFVNLPTLIELKLAAALSAPQRIKDRADVLELIHLLKLPATFADRLNPYVRDAFRELAALPPPHEFD
jgi:hypothetical protein